VKCIHVLECYNKLKNIREKYLTCSSLKELFENVDATTITAFIKDINFVFLSFLQLAIGLGALFLL